MNKIFFLFICYFTFVGSIYPRANSLNFQSRHDNNSISSIGLHSKNENADLDANFTLKLFKEFIKSNKYHIVSFLLLSFLVLVLVRKTSLGGYSRIEIEKKLRTQKKYLNFFPIRTVGLIRSILKRLFMRSLSNYSNHGKIETMKV